MSRICPITNDVVLYMECLECKNKLCKQVLKSSKESGYSDKKILGWKCENIIEKNKNN